MKNYIKKSSKPTFVQKGLKGYIYPLLNKKLEIYFVDVKTGHDTHIISKKITHIYYTLEGKGNFDINGVKRKIKTGDLIEILPHVEYAYSGKMKLLLIMNPPWFKENEIITKKNPAVEYAP